MARYGWTDIVLNEMIIYGEDKPKSFIIGFDEWIYIGDDNFFDKKQDEIIAKIRKRFDDNELGYKLQYPKDLKMSSAINLIMTLQKYVHGIFYGYMDENRILYIYNHLPISPYSALMNKIKKEIDFNGIKYIDEEEASKVFSKNLYNNKSVNAFHGTNSEIAKKILTSGLRPNKTGSYGIKHDGIVFLALDKTFSIQHANRSSELETNTKKLQYLPVIIEFDIPDKNKLIPDYDMENMTGIEQYYPVKTYGLVKSKETISNNPMRVSKDFGLFGYKGIIYPNHINNIYVPSVDEVKRRFDGGFYRQQFRLSDLIKIKKDEYNKYLDSVKEYLE